jgi:uncharacterized membrane protein
MTHTKADRDPVAREAAEPEWKTAFRKAKQEAESELQEIHREAANRARALLRRAS